MRWRSWLGTSASSEDAATASITLSFSYNATAVRVVKRNAQVSGKAVAQAVINEGF